MSETLPFVVPSNWTILDRRAGKDSETVWTVEMGIFNATIREYTEPLSWERQWCYPDWVQASLALEAYLDDPEAVAPVGWIRHINAAGLILRPAEPVHE